MFQGFPGMWTWEYHIPRFGTGYVKIFPGMENTHNGFVVYSHGEGWVYWIPVEIKVIFYNIYHIQHHSLIFFFTFFF